jgi:uncharacterized protein YjiS (DUF1127 family)
MMDPVASRAGQVFGRLVMLSLAGAAALWGLEAISQRAEAGVDTRVVATRILQDKSYTTDRLLQIRGRMGRGDQCADPTFARAVVQLRIFEQSLIPDSGLLPEVEREDLEHRIEKVTVCEPNDGFFPLVSAALALSDGRQDRFLSELRHSYRNGPYENWIALRRSPLALTRFSDLPEDLQKKARAEFTNLINSGLHREAAAIFDVVPLDAQAAVLDAIQAGATPRLRSAFLTRLIEGRSRPRSRFKKSRGLIENFSLPSGTSLDRSE